MSFFTNAQHFSVNDASFNNFSSNFNYNFHSGKTLRDYAVNSALYCSEERYPPPNVHPGTRTQVLGILRRWILDQSKATSVYWLSGPAGVGKSAIAQNISEMFSDRQEGSLDRRLAATFFFSRTDPLRNCLGSFFLTLAYQLVTNAVLGPLLKTRIISETLNNPGIFKSTLERQFEDLIAKPCHELGADSWKTLPRLIVIDGLDECIDIPSQERLLSIIRQAKYGPNPIPFDFLICSRPEPRIRNAFGHQHFHAILDRTEIGDSPQSSKDIERYLRDEFRRIRHDHQTVLSHLPPNWPGDDIIGRLVQRACGQFIYARTVLSYVGEYSGHPAERLEVILNLTVPEDYDSPYPDLDLLYIQILSSCKESELLKDILAQLLFPFKGLDKLHMNSIWGYEYTIEDGLVTSSPSYIEHLLHLSRGKVWTVLFGLHSVLHVPETPREDIHVLHASFVDFLKDRKRSGTYFVDPRPGANQERIAYYLLTRISHTLTLSQHVQVNELISEYDVYAWDYWHLHCQKAFASRRILLMLEQLDLCCRINTALRYFDHCFRPGSRLIFHCNPFSKQFSAIASCFSKFSSIVDWAKDSSSQFEEHASRLDTIAEKYGLFTLGYRVHIRLKVPSEKDYLMRAISTLKYNTVPGPRKAGLAQCLPSNHPPLGWDEACEALWSPTHFARILPLRSQSHSDLASEFASGSTSSLPPIFTTANDPLVMECDIIFAEIHKEVALKCLQICRDPNSPLEIYLGEHYAKPIWTQHILETVPSEEMFQVVLENVSLIPPEFDVKKAITWAMGAAESPTRANCIQQLQHHYARFRGKPHDRAEDRNGELAGYKRACSTHDALPLTSPSKRSKRGREEEVVVDGTSDRRLKRRS